MFGTWIDRLFAVLGVCISAYAVYVLRNVTLGVGRHYGGWRALCAKDKWGGSWLLADGPTAFLVLGVCTVFVREWVLLLPLGPALLMRIAIPRIMAAESGVKSDYGASLLSKQAALHQWNRYQAQRKWLQILQSMLSFPIAAYGLYRLWLLMPYIPALTTPLAAIAAVVVLFVSAFALVLLVFIVASNAIAD